MTDEKKHEEGTEMPSEQNRLPDDPAKEEPIASPAEESAETQSEAPAEASANETPISKEENDEAQYAFRWDYADKTPQVKPRVRTLSVRPGLFYGLMVGLIFAVALVILLIVLVLGERRVALGGTVSGAVERVVYVNGSGDAEEELAVEAAVAKMLPSSVSIIVTSKTGTGVGSGVG